MIRPGVPLRAFRARESVFEKILKNKVLKAAAGRIVPGKAVKLAGVWGSSGPLAAAALGRLTGRGVLFVTSHLEAADEVADDIEVFTGEAAQIFPATFPARRR